MLLFQSTLLIRGATIDVSDAATASAKISIHAPHTRSDLMRCQLLTTTRAAFQSTLLIRGATRKPQYCIGYAKFQSTLLIRGATAFSSIQRYFPGYFNPRSSYEERRQYSILSFTVSMYFNPRSSYEERLDYALKVGEEYGISIHAPHTRSDSPSSAATKRGDISIHAPHTRSDCRKTGWDRSFWIFQSTLLIRGATIFLATSSADDNISIHAPHTRSDILQLSFRSL